MNYLNSSPTSSSGTAHRDYYRSSQLSSPAEGLEDHRRTLPGARPARPTSQIAFTRAQRVTQYLAAVEMGRLTIPDLGSDSEQSGVDPRRSRRASTPRRSRHTDNPFLTPVSPNFNSPYRGTTYEPPRNRILFYHKHDPHYGFTNFSPHPVVYQGKKYPTSEHLFQSFKFQGHRPGLAEHIRTCSDRPSAAFSEARRFQPEVRHDWKQVNIEKMDITLWHKFTQHADLKAELLATGNDELVEDSDKDAFWGVGADGKGLNHLGKALERLRSRLRNGY